MFQNLAKKSEQLFYFVFLQFILTWPIYVSAQGKTPPIIPVGADANQPLALPRNIGGTDNASFLQNTLLPGIASTIIAITGAASLLMVILSGVTMITAYGKPDKFEAAKKTLTYAITGLLIASLSYAIVALVSSFTF